MVHQIWPFFGLRIFTPRLELRYVDDKLAAQIAELAVRGIHGPDMMPFAFPWSEVASPELERNTMQYYWRKRAELAPTRWEIPFAVIEDGQVVGTTAVFASDFAILRQFETGSWLGLSFQGRGIGKEMRAASLHLGFAGLGAHYATTAAWEDNGPSRGVTARLGYREAGRRRTVRKESAGLMVGYEMPREHWETVLHRDDIRIEGLEPCLALIGLGAG